MQQLRREKGSSLPEHLEALEVSALINTAPNLQAKPVMPYQYVEKNATFPQS